jgi:excisionase family DNA binding protein
MTLLTQREAAELMSLSERTLERWRVAGDGPKFVRLGRSIRYRLTEIEAHIAACSVSSTSAQVVGSGRAL